MAWLFGQVFLLCALSFLLGSLVTWLFLARQRRIETGRAVRTVHTGEIADGSTPPAIEPDRGRDTPRSPARGLTEPSDGPGPEVLPGALLPTEGERSDSVSVRLAYSADGESPWRDPEHGDRPSGARHAASSGSASGEVSVPEPRMVVPGPYRNSARPAPDGTAPAPHFTVKGNQKSKLYHTSDSPYFARTKATVWFKTENDARQAGFTPSSVRRSTPAR